jgi:hypothetical protein
MALFAGAVARPTQQTETLARIRVRRQLRKRQARRSEPKLITHNRTSFPSKGLSVPYIIRTNSPAYLGHF